MKSIVEKIIFGSRWLLIPFYLVLVIALFIYMSVDVKGIIELTLRAVKLTMDEDEAMLMILKLLDIAMIANLVKMIITGSYTSFVDKHHANSEKSSSGTLKVKMGMSLVGVSSVNLLQSFVNAAQVDMELIEKKVILHSMFLLGAVALAIVDNIHVKSEAIAEETEHKYPEPTKIITGKH